jgi:hypothetical protein
MRKIFCCILLFFGFLFFCVELFHHFKEFKLIYYNLNPEKYFESDKLYIYNIVNSQSSGYSGFNSRYYGVLANNKEKTNVYYNSSFVERNLKTDLNGDYLNVWYCEKLNETIIKKKSKLERKVYINGILIYILIFSMIPCLIYLIKKNNKNEK